MASSITHPTVSEGPVTQIGNGQIVPGPPSSVNPSATAVTARALVIPLTAETVAAPAVTTQPTVLTSQPVAATGPTGTPTLSVTPANGKVSSSSPCYYPNGQKNNIDVPCDPSASVSMCCGDPASCLSNGLCQTIDDQQMNGNISYARGTCTDNQWGSSTCPQHCLSNQDSATNSSAYNFRSGGVQVWECGGSQGHSSSADYCCESEREGTRCCSTPTAIFRLGPATVGNFASSTSSPSASTLVSPTSSSMAPSLTSSPPASTLASPASSATAPSPTATSTPSPQQKAPAGEIAGGVIGGVAFLALAVFIWWFWSRRRKTKDMPRSSWVKPELSADPKSNHSHSVFPYELQANPKRPPELPDHCRYELPGDLGGSEMMTLEVGSKGR